MGFTPPPYPYDRLEPMKAKADAHPGGAVDLSVGTPNDPPPAFVLEALATSNTERGYPPSIGSLAYRQAASRWMQRRLGVDVPAAQVAACVGTKEFVGTLPQYLHLRTPERDTILHPAIAYPTYAMGATLAGLRSVAVADLSAISEDDASRALALWVNSPGNPTGQLADLAAAAAWGREHGVPVFSDECYVEFTWAGGASASGPPASERSEPASIAGGASASGPPASERSEPASIAGGGRTILEHGTEGVVAVHSLSKRSNLAGARAGFYAGDADLVGFLQEVRKHAGFMVPGPVQAAAVAALDDDEHVAKQRQRYAERIEFLAAVLSDHYGIPVPRPAGGFYLWIEAPGGDAWAFAEQLAAEAGALVTPGDTFGPLGAGHVRIALVQPMDRLQLVADRLLTPGSRQIGRDPGVKTVE